MKRKALAKAAASSLLVGTTMVGCTGAAFHPSAIARPSENPDRLAADVEKALARRDGAAAIPSAEEAVRIAPDNAAYRQLLGRTYVASGRFASAETALTDAMTLGNRDPRTIVSLALVKAALGQNEAARDLLATHADVVPADDYGLAMAMAGDANEGVRILAQAIQDPSATARTRQNLAYAYALAGRWKDARMVAGIDLDASAAAQRITQWAQTAAPSMAEQRVAVLMGVSIDRTDVGQPAALALAPQAAPVQVAEAPVAAASAPLPAMAASDPETVQPVASIELPASAPALAFSPAVKPVAFVAPRAVAPRRQFAAWRPAVRSGNGTWVVQLGAFENQAVAKEKWVDMATRNGAIASLPVITSQIKINGMTYARLAVGGFDERAEAVALCRAIRARRGQCFVRENTPDAAPQRWAIASSKPRQYASR